MMAAVAAAAASVAVMVLLQSTPTCAAAAATTALEKTWTLYHSLNGGRDFARRASIALTADPETDAVDLSIVNDNSTLNQETYRSAMAEGSLYQLKLVDDDEGGGDANTAATSHSFLLSSVPGCQLLRANFREEIVLTLGPKASAISLTYSPLVSPLAPKSCHDNELWERKLANNQIPDGWDSRISWETATPGMTLRAVMPQYKPPPGLRWLPRLGANGKLYQPQGPPGTGGDGKKEGGAGGGGPNNQEPVDNSPMGFLRRYWYILLPLLVSNFISGPEPPAAPAPAEGGTVGGSGGAPGAASSQGGGGGGPTAAPGGGGGAAKSRRGKRG